ncbi:hypothetical protein ACWEWH_35900, partial [Streptomyces sp. NPDC003877]
PPLTVARRPPPPPRGGGRGGRPPPPPPLDLIAIDNLPSLLPLESSADFSAALLPQLLDFGVTGPWGRCLDRFRQANREHGFEKGDVLDH